MMVMDAMPSTPQMLSTVVTMPRIQEITIAVFMVSVTYTASGTDDGAGTGPAGTASSSFENVAFRM